MIEPTENQIEWAKEVIEKAHDAAIVTTVEDYRFRVDLDAKTVYVKPLSNRFGMDQIDAAFRAIGYTMEDDTEPQDPDVDHLTNVATELMHGFVDAGLPLKVELIKMDGVSYPSLLLSHLHDDTLGKFHLTRNEEGCWKVEYLVGDGGEGSWAHSMSSRLPYRHPNVPEIVLNLLNGIRILMQEVQKRAHKYN
jgi:hypothetical protein